MGGITSTHPILPLPLLNSYSLPFGVISFWYLLYRPNVRWGDRTGRGYPIPIEDIEDYQKMVTFVSC